MSKALLSELESQATFVAGKGSYLRSASSPEVEQAIDRVGTLLERIGGKLESPDITGGTTSDPDIILSLFWMVRKAHGIYGLTVDFMKDGTFRLSWSSPEVDHYTLHDLTLEDVLKLDPVSIFRNLELSARINRGVHVNKQ